MVELGNLASLFLTAGGQGKPAMCTLPQDFLIVRPTVCWCGSWCWPSLSTPWSQREKAMCDAATQTLHTFDAWTQTEEPMLGLEQSGPVVEEAMHVPLPVPVSPG